MSRTLCLRCEKTDQDCMCDPGFQHFVDVDSDETQVHVSSLETLKKSSLRTVQLEFLDDHDCMSFQHWWGIEGQRVYDAWKKTR